MRDPAGKAWGFRRTSRPPITPQTHLHAYLRAVQVLMGRSLANYIAKVLEGPGRKAVREVHA